MVEKKPRKRKEIPIKCTVTYYSAREQRIVTRDRVDYSELSPEARKRIEDSAYEFAQAVMSQLRRWEADGETSLDDLFDDPDHTQSPT